MKAMSRVKVNASNGAVMVVLHQAVMPQENADNLPVVVLGLAGHWQSIPKDTPRVWVVPLADFDPGPNGEPPKFIILEE